MKLPDVLHVFLVSILGMSACSYPRASMTIGASDADQTAAPTAPTVKLGVVPQITLDRRAPASQPDAARIKKIIASLVQIDSPDYGLSCTLSGTAFAPIAGSEEVGGMLLTNHQIKPSAALRELVKLGPSALPFLLEALDDKTPTHLTIKHETDFGGMWFANEIWGNPVNAAEQRVVASVPRDFEDLVFSPTDSYTVKVGDVCFVAIGQIVGRCYQAVRYQPTACIVINSPTENAALAGQVRAIWSSGDPGQHLLDSLLLDYSTEGIYDGGSLDGWGVGSRLRVPAAMRLLYYFPRETTRMIAEKLRHLNVEAVGPGAGTLSSPSQLDAYIKREVSNGVRTADFIKAVAWSQALAIRKELTGILKRSTDPGIVAAALSGIDPAQDELVRERVQALIDNLPADEGGPFGDGYNLLVGIGQRGDDQVKLIFQRYLVKAGIQRRRTMCHVLRRTRGEWAIELLAPFLSDERDTGWNYAVDPGQNEPRLPIRICDEAAETISRHNVDMPFRMLGQHKDLNRQIEAMRERINAQRK